MTTTVNQKRAGKRSDNFVEIPPNAARTLQALRELGYDSYAAICDLVDNSIDAGAKSIAVDVRVLGRTFVIEVRDDGYGMDRTTLAEAIRLGSDTESGKSRLGKYGMGLTTASLSLAKTLVVFTRRNKEQAYEATFDVSTVEAENRWWLDVGPIKSSEEVEQIGDHGTIVRLSNIDRIDDTNHFRFCAGLRERLGEVFRNFIGHGTAFYLNRKLVTAVDPLMRDNPKTKQHVDQVLDLGHGKKARLVVVELPDLGEQEEALGIVPRRSGFFISRNKRQIMAAQTLGLYQHHHSYSHFRAELSFDSSADDVWHVDVKKTSVHPGDQIIDKIKKAVRPWIEKSGREGRERAVSKSKINHTAFEKMLAHPQHGRDLPIPATIRWSEAVHGMGEALFQAEKKDGITHITYNKRHPIVQIVSDIPNQRAHAVLDLFCYALAETGTDAAIEKVGKVLSNILIAGSPEDTWARRDAQKK